MPENNPENGPEKAPEHQAENVADSSGNEWGRSRRSSQSPSGAKTMADLLFLPETERGLVNWLLRQHSASLSEIAGYLMQDEAQTQAIIDRLAADGFVRFVEAAAAYEPALTSRRGRQVPSNIWNALS